MQKQILLVFKQRNKNKMNKQAWMNIKQMNIFGFSLLLIVTIIFLIGYLTNL